MTNNNAIHNRSMNEKSPYLLQHPYNLVDWFPWGQEAFEKANAEEKPNYFLLYTHSIVIESNLPLTDDKHLIEKKENTLVKQTKVFSLLQCNCNRSCFILCLSPSCTPQEPFLQAAQKRLCQEPCLVV